MNEHERAARYVDLHEHRLRLLGEIAEAQAGVIRVQDEMKELCCGMGPVCRARIFELLEAK